MVHQLTLSEKHVQELYNSLSLGQYKGQLCTLFTTERCILFCPVQSCPFNGTAVTKWCGPKGFCYFFIESLFIYKNGTEWF